jgi:hypothetical protein
MWSVEEPVVGISDPVPIAVVFGPVAGVVRRHRRRWAR